MKNCLLVIGLTAPLWIVPTGLVLFWLIGVGLGAA
jgi:hypothetical protein